MTLDQGRRRRQSSDPDDPSVPSTIYDTEYFLSNACDGLSDYLTGGVSVVKGRELDLLGVRAGHSVLDLGCGRGEVAAELLRRGAQPTAIDYSWDAVALTGQLIGRQALVAQADGVALPFPNGSFDRVLLGDVIEHLPWPLAIRAMAEVDRVLAPGGWALVHTSPNTWFIAIVKPPLRIALRLLRRHEVLARFAEYDRLRGPMHPNELNPVTLPRLMRQAGVKAVTWVDRDVLRSGASEWTENLTASRLVRIIGAVAGAWPFRLLLGNDMYALVEASGTAPTRRTLAPSDSCSSPTAPPATSD
ncbi:MAG TPA: class I SAM-dependent methyltransferase [Acidimicrobiales bacterium]